jgi:hypothetical protein
MWDPKHKDIFDMTSNFLFYIFRTRPARLRGPPSLLFSGDRVTFATVKRPGRGVDQPSTYSAGS